MERLSEQSRRAGDTLGDNLMARAIETGDLTLAQTVQELRADQVVIPLPERQITVIQRLKQLGGKMLIGSKRHQTQVFEFPKPE